MPKLITLLNDQLRELLRLNDLDAFGNKAEMVDRLKQYFGTDEIDQTTLNELFPDKKLVNELANMKSMMNTLVQTVQQLGERLNTVNVQVNNNEHGLVDNDDIGSQHDDNDEGEVEVNEQHELVSVCDTNVSTRYQIAPTQNYSVKDIAETIPNFDPSNESSLSAEQFVQHVDGAKSSYGWNEKCLLLAIYSRLKGVARMWFDSRTALFTTWREFKDELLNEFGASYDEAEIHLKMSRTFRRTDEKIIDYCFRIHALGKRFNLSESAIIRYARNGMKHQALQTAIAANKFKTMKELRETICGYFENMPSTSKPKDNVGSKPKGFYGKTETRATDTKPYGDAREFTCYNCNGKGHMAKYCTQPQKKQRCPYCQRTTHRAEDCPEKPQNITAKKSYINAIADTDETYNDVLNTIIVNGKTLTAFMDSGSSVSLIRKSCANKFGEPFEKCWRELCGFAGGTYIITKKMPSTLIIDNQEFKTDLFLVEDGDISEDILIGRDLICSKGNRLVIENGQCRVEPTKTSTVASINETPLHSEVIRILDENRQCIAEQIADLGKCSIEKMEIKLTSDEPINMKPYRTAFAKREIVSNIVKELLDNKIIRLSKSAYASPVVLVEKKNREHRLCVDYRGLNKITQRIPFPMPNLEEQFAQLAGNSYFSTLDLRMGYHQIEMDEDSKQYTAFVTTDGHYEYERMPFGLVNAPAVFQRVMNTLIVEMKPGEVLVYLDDVIIPSATIEEGIERLERFVKILIKHGLTIRLEKCQFLTTEIEHLGHVVNENGIRPGQKKITAIQNFKPPTTVTEVRRFLGLTGFFRKFVKDYAIIAKPITKLLNKTECDNFQWTAEQQQAFELLIRLLSNAPLLALYDLKKKHEVHTDACAIGLAGVLLQSTTGEHWQPVMYFSRHCTPAEQKYHSYEQEVLAVVESLERFRVYLLGKTFRIVTDCSAIVKTKEQHELKPRIARWWLKLQEYEFSLVHRPGTRLAHVDALSRAPTGYEEPCEPAGHTYTLTDQQSDWVVAMQLRDERAKYIVSVLTGKIKAPDENQIKREYELTNDRLYYKTPHGPKFYVPKAVRISLIRHYHDEMGHFAIEKTLQRLSKYFWFPKMRKLAKEYINACVDCCYNKAQRSKPEGELHYSETTPIPFRTLHIDHLGPFIRSRRGNTHLLVITDAFSKFCVLKAVKSTKTGPVITALNEIISYFGLPDRIISDRGTSFTSSIFAKFCQINEIQHIKTAVRTPRANGQVERSNATILNSIKTSMQEAKKWDENLVQLQWVINSQPNSTTRFAPNELVFNFNLKDVVHNHLVAAINADMPQEPVLPVNEKYDLALKNIAAERAKWKARFDKKRKKPTKYNKGDIVVITHEPAATGESRKLEPKFRGPYAIAKILENDRYVVADVPGLQLKKRPYNTVFASDQLKPWCQGCPELVYTDEEYDTSDDE